MVLRNILLNDEDGNARTMITMEITDRHMAIEGRFAPLVQDACKDYAKSKDGAWITDENDNRFDWFDMLLYLPDEFAAKHGFTIKDTEEPPEDNKLVDWEVNGDESLI